MAATSRVVVLMSPAEKAALEAKVARRPGLSAGEFVRRAVDAYEGDDAGEEAELKTLLGVLAGLHEETVARLAATERRLDDTLAHLQRRNTQG